MSTKFGNQTYRRMNNWRLKQNAKKDFSFADMQETRLNSCIIRSYKNKYEQN